VEDSFIVGKKLHLTKSGGSEAEKPWTLKSGGLEPRSLTEVYTYGCHRPLPALPAKAWPNN